MLLTAVKEDFFSSQSCSELWELLTGVNGTPLIRRQKVQWRNIKVRWLAFGGGHTIKVIK